MFPKRPGSKSLATICAEINKRLPAPAPFFQSTVTFFQATRDGLNALIDYLHTRPLPSFVSQATELFVEETVLPIETMYYYDAVFDPKEGEWEVTKWGNETPSNEYVEKYGGWLFALQISSSEPNKCSISFCRANICPAYIGD